MSKITVKGAGFKEMYAEYTKRGTGTLSLEEFKAVVYTANKHIDEELLNGRRVRLPHLGVLKIVKYKPKDDAMYFDYCHFKKTGEKRFLTNIHSDGYIARIQWDRRFCTIPNQTLYNFKACKGLKRALADVMKTSGGHRVFEEAIKYR